MTPPTDNAPTVLSRYAKAIASVVEAGGPEPTPFMRAAMFDDDMKPKTVGRIYREPIIAVLEKYVREDVVVWAERDAIYMVEPCRKDGSWVYCVGDTFVDVEFPTEAHIAFLEAIASVVAGEKGEVG